MQPLKALLRNSAGLMGFNRGFALSCPFQFGGLAGRLPPLRRGLGSVLQILCQRGRSEIEKPFHPYAVRQNFSMRMTIRRLTRLTNAHSKIWENHEAALALYFAYYNFCRIHSSIRCTPAMESGLTGHIWTLRELLAA